MSTSLIYHAFGLQGYAYVHQKFEEGRIIFRIRPKAKLMRCSRCKSTRIIRRGLNMRLLRTLPIGFKPVCLNVEMPRVECRTCGFLGRIRIGIAAPRRWHTYVFERFVLAITKVMTLKDVSRLVGIGWDCVKDILRRNLARRFAKPPLSRLRYIAIDEISVKKGHKYVTLVMDLQSGAVVFVGDGKGADSLLPFWKKLHRSRAQIQAVATDMSPAYIGAVRENLPGTPLVFDHFHVVKLMNEALTEIRRGLYHELKNLADRKVLKGSRWILLKNPENLCQEKDEASRLQEALAMNEPLAMSYYMKEDLRQIWSQESKDKAKAALNSWITRAQTSGIGPLMRIGGTLAAHKSGILNWYDHNISSGPLEGTNNKIKVMKRMAYGYRDMEFFKLRILAIHEAKYVLTG